MLLSRNNQGDGKGKERIQGGRAALRQALYFPAIVAARFNVDLKLIYDRLIAAGKQKKVRSRGHHA
ncbi:hypothetical protein ACU4GR_10785 [Methylobacterium oryzae CBMB20]